MASRGLILFVEGSHDKHFFEAIILPIFSNLYEFAQVICYKEPTSLKDISAEKIDSFIQNLNPIGYEYLFVTDMNEAPCITQKKDELQRIYKSLDKERIVVVKREIESWYIAGISDEVASRLQVNIPLSTDNITKERFQQITQRNLRDILFRQEILSDFSIENAIKRNSSFCYFIHKFCRTTQSI